MGKIFIDKKRQRNLIIEDGIKKIKEMEFMCQNIANVFLPEGLEVIEDQALSKNRIKGIKLPKSLTTIGYRALANTPLDNLDIPRSTTNIDPTAFEFDPIKQITFYIKNRKIILNDLGRIKRLYIFDKQAVILSFTHIIFINNKGDITKYIIENLSYATQVLDDKINDIAQKHGISKVLNRNTKK